MSHPRAHRKSVQLLLRASSTLEELRTTFVELMQRSSCVPSTLGVHRTMDDSPVALELSIKTQFSYASIDCMGRWTENKQLGGSSGEKHLPSRHEPWLPSTSTSAYIQNSTTKYSTLKRTRFKKKLPRRKWSESCV